MARFIREAEVDVVSRDVSAFGYRWHIVCSVGPHDPCDCCVHGSLQWRCRIAGSVSGDVLSMIADSVVLSCICILHIADLAYLHQGRHSQVDIDQCTIASPYIVAAVRHAAVVTTTAMSYTRL